MSETQTSGKLAAKLAKVMASVERIAKTGRNNFHNYDYATEADIVASVRKAMADQNVMLIPSVSSMERIEMKRANGKDTALTTVTMHFTWIDGDSGERLHVQWMGQGIDAEDKGVYKAITGAEKYVLLKTFLIPTGDDPEKDDDRQPETPQPQARPVVTSTTTTMANVARTGATRTPTARPSARPSPKQQFVDTAQRLVSAPPDDVPHPALTADDIPF